MKIDVAIEPIIPDNTAFTVLLALRELGYERLSRVERSEHVFVSVSEGTPVKRVIGDLAKAEVLFNPNKHRMSYALPDARKIEPLEFEAFVRDKDENNDRLRELLVTTFRLPNLLDIERAIGWRLYEREGSTPLEQLEWACMSLLCNPVSQRYDIRPRPVRTQVGEPAGLAANSPK
jgi:phosphoribosylformylglycinamidine (FGAM) synthase PurS component